MITLQKKLIFITKFGEEATSAGFLAGPLSWRNCNLRMLVFAEGGKPENPAGENPRP